MWYIFSHHLAHSLPCIWSEFLVDCLHFCGLFLLGFVFRGSVEPRILYPLSTHSSLELVLLIYSFYFLDSIKIICFNVIFYILVWNINSIYTFNIIIDTFKFRSTFCYLFHFCFILLFLCIILVCLNFVLLFYIRSYYLTQYSPKPYILFFLIPEFWDYRCVSLCLTKILLVLCLKILVVL